MKTITFYLLSFFLFSALAQGQDIAGPPGSGAFGTQVLTLANGNFVVTDPAWDNSDTPDLGAVYVYDGPSRRLLKTITGRSANDQVGSGGVVQLHNGNNFLIMSPDWNNPDGPTQVGAITWVDGAAGVSFTVNATNSLIGLLARERLGTTPVTQLSNGNYIVRHPNWRGTLGAVTWASGSSANPVGRVDATNSLVGQSPLDFVGDTPPLVLTNEHYVITCKDWNSGRGAVAWADGTKANPVGEIGEANALVGKRVADFVGSGGTWALPNGHYVTSSPQWDNDGLANVGAVTWGNGLTGTHGAVGVANSIVGNLVDDRVGFGGIVPLTNSNYVVHSPFWNNPDGTGNDAGAITWANGGTASAFAVAATNSLIGNQGERLGQVKVTTLPNGHYVAVNETWSGLRGAVTWCNGNQASPVDKARADNSLIGLRRTNGNGPSTTDAVGSNGITVLANGDYVVNSHLWNEQRGAITRCSGVAASPVGEVTANNSLTGELPGNLVGLGGVAALDNGRYVVLSPNWEVEPTKLNVGAITLCPASGLTGVVTLANSLTGSTANDQVGNGGVTKLTNGNYVVLSLNWANTALAVQNAGALTWAAAGQPLLGEVGPDNSLVGSQLFTFASSPKVYALKNGNYVLFNEARYLAWGNGSQGTFGPLTNDNTLRGLHTHLVELANGNYVIYSRITNRGWVTWCSGTKAVPIGAAGADISLVDSLFDDRVGHEGVFPLPNGNYVVSSSRWFFGRGANTYGVGTGGTVGFIRARNSILDLRFNQ
jgi:hypothetical protein